MSELPRKVVPEMTSVEGFERYVGGERLRQSSDTSGEVKKCPISAGA